MNNFIPALIAVLLAELGGRSLQFARLPKLTLAATLLGISVGAAAFAGNALAPTMNAQARALMLGLALILTGCGQFGKAPTGDPPASITATSLYVWRSGAPFLTFAFAIWTTAPIGAAAGALAGFAGAVAIGVMPLPPTTMRWTRLLSGALLLLTGSYAAIWALRLI